MFFFNKTKVFFKIKQKVLPKLFGYQDYKIKKDKYIVCEIIDNKNYFNPHDFAEASINNDQK